MSQQAYTIFNRIMFCLRRSFSPPFVGFEQRYQVRHFSQPIRDASGVCFHRPEDGADGLTNKYSDAPFHS
jgi:hypothetical protein